MEVWRPGPEPADQRGAVATSTLDKQSLLMEVVGRRSSNYLSRLICAPPPLKGSYHPGDEGNQHKEIAVNSGRLGALPIHNAEHEAELGGHGPRKPVAPTQYPCDLGEGQRGKRPSKRRQVASSHAGKERDKWHEHQGQAGGRHKGPE